MIIRHWNVWQTYSSYFLEPLDLITAGQNLVQSGLAKAAYFTEGVVWWAEEGQVRTGEAKLDHESAQSASWVLPSINDPYVAEVLSQALRMRFYETYHLSSSMIEGLPYVRGYLGTCQLVFEDRSVTLYPQVKLYSDGVYLVEFRTVSGGDDYPLDDFIDKEVNLFQHRARNYECPPEALALAARAEAARTEGWLFRRLNVHTAVKYTDQAIASRISQHESGDFIYEMAPSRPGPADRSEASLVELFDCIREALSEALNAHREGWRFVLLGPGKTKYHIGTTWAGRPSVYLLSFSDQSKSTTHIYRTKKAELIRIMARLPRNERPLPDKYLGPNLRNFDDFGVHVSKALTLWIFGKDALDRDAVWADQHFGHVVFPHQIQAELTDYAYAAQRQAMERSMGPLSTVSDALKEKRSLAELQSLLRNCSHYGELQEFYQYAWRELELDDLRKRTEDNIAIKIQQISDWRDHNVRRFGWLLSLLFGLSGVGNLANSLLKPFWTVTGWWAPKSSEAQEILRWGLSAFIIATCVLVLWRLTAGQKNRVK